MDHERIQDTFTYNKNKTIADPLFFLSLFLQVMETFKYQAYTVDSRFMYFTYIKMENTLTVSTDEGEE